MNFRTTLILLILVAAGGVFFWLGPWIAPLPPPGPAAASTNDAGTLNVLQDDITPEKLTRIQLRHGDRDVILERSPSGEWTLPGKWPTRKAEVDELVHLVGGLRSRFAAYPLGDPPDLKRYGLDRSPLTITANVADKEFRLAFGEEPVEEESRTSNRFSRPTYVRLDERPEAIRLTPGIIAALDRPADFYQQRRLFPSERVARDGDSQEKVERLTAQSVVIKGKDSGYTLVRAGEDWELQEPVRDRADPDKLKTILTAVPDIWAEQFVVNPKPDLAEYGLKEPEQTVRVTRPGGDTVTLLIGRQSQVKTRTVMRPAPNFGGGPPMPPQREVLHDEYRFAKLQDNHQIFEVKADKPKDLFVAADTLRDAHLARFTSGDARQVELSQNGQEIVLVKEKDKWRLQKPLEAEAETSKVTELLDKLSGLQAREKDVLDKADPKAYGLDKPLATVKVTIEEGGKGQDDAKPKKTKAFSFHLGKHDTEKSKLYVQVAGWERVNAVDDGVLKLVQRPALAYRDRRVLDFNTTDVAKIKVERNNQSLTLEQVKGSWRLTAPAQAEADSAKTGTLVGELSRLEAVEYVSEAAKPDELAQDYGLSQPALTAQISFTDANKPAQTLLIGKQRPDKQEYFAKLASAPGVFVVKKSVRDTLDQDSLALRPAEVWQIGQDDIAEVRVRKEGPEYRLKREGQTWKITGPFEATAMTDMARPMAEELSNLRCERYAAHVAKDLGTYGLDKPYLRVTVQEAEKEKPKIGGETTKDEGDKAAAKNPPKERVLLIGKPTDKDAKSRFAKLGDAEAVFVVGAKTVAALDHSALDWLDRKLLSLDSTKVERVRSSGAEGTLTLQREKDEWQVVEAPAAPFPADSESIGKLLAVCSNLQAVRFAAYDAKIDPTAYGLDKPASTLTFTVVAPAENDKTTKPTEHTITLGKAVDGGAGQRFARVDNGPGVAVLGPAAVSELTQGYLDFVNRKVWQLDPKTVTRIERSRANELLVVDKDKAGWRLLKPIAARADDVTLDRLADDLSALRATRVAAYPAKDLKPFGLDTPQAVVTLRSAASEKDKGKEHTLKIGKVADEPSGDRFATADGSTVVVLPATLTRPLLASELQFRDHTLARLTDPDGVTLERGPRKAVFTKEDGIWRLTEPVQAEAEQADLEDLLKAVAPLRADELVTDKPTDLKPFGLDKPEARWHFHTGGKEVLNLLIGRREKVKSEAKETDGARCYAKLAAGDVVCLLSPELTAKVLGEYRKRAVWPTPLDAVQTEKLSYGYASNSFVLEKAENDWHVAGKPEAKLKAEAVREALDALAGLKAARYIVDRGAELNLYGLEPPQLALEIQTRTGKRVLHVGRPEGESKRYYARVFEGSDSPVFVISEVDAGRIVRPLAAFILQPAKTPPPARPDTQRP
jgi:hypothetical protein